MEIKFKRLRKKHDSGYSCIDKSWDLEYCQDASSKDGIWLYPKTWWRVMIDCDYKTWVFSLKFDWKDFKEAN